MASDMNPDSSRMLIIVEEGDTLMTGFKTLSWSPESVPCQKCETLCFICYLDFSVMLFWTWFECKHCSNRQYTHTGFGMVLCKAKHLSRE